MKAIRIHEYGGPEQLRFEEAPVPEAGSGQVLVRVHATSVNPIDYKLVSGAFRQFMPLQLPWIPGGDFSGIVETVGPGVAGVKPGDAVYGNNPGGGAYAQFVAVPAAIVGPRPRTLSDLEAASVPGAAQTAWQALFDHGQLQRGQTVLVHRCRRRGRDVRRPAGPLEGGEGAGHRLRSQRRVSPLAGGGRGNRLPHHSLRGGREGGGPGAGPGRRGNAGALLRRAQARRSARRDRAAPL